MKKYDAVIVTPAGRKALAEAKAEEARRNPLIRAVELYDEMLDAQDAIMVAAVGQPALSDPDLFDRLHEEVTDLIDEASYSVVSLSARARIARLNLIWKDFVREYKNSKRREIKNGNGNGKRSGTPQATRGAGNTEANDGKQAKRRARHNSPCCGKTR